jgi:hypothetical protein
VRPVSIGLTTPRAGQLRLFGAGIFIEQGETPCTTTKNIGARRRVDARECAGPSRSPESPCSTHECLRRSGAHPPIHVAVQPERNLCRAGEPRSSSSLKWITPFAAQSFRQPAGPPKCIAQLDEIGASQQRGMRLRRCWRSFVIDKRRILVGDVGDRSSQRQHAAEIVARSISWNTADSTFLM